VEKCIPNLLWIVWMAGHAFRTYQFPSCIPMKGLCIAIAILQENWMPHFWLHHCLGYLVGVK
jgi:hypothetical protein